MYGTDNAELARTIRNGRYSGNEIVYQLKCDIMKELHTNFTFPFYPDTNTGSCEAISDL